MEEVKVPSPGESISEVDLASWTVSEGEYVELDQVIAEIDSDKATLELTAPFAGAISLKAEEGDTIEVGSVVAEIDTSAKAPEGAPKAEIKQEAAPAKEEAKSATTPKQETSHATGHPSPSAIDGEHQ